MSKVIPSLQRMKNGYPKPTEAEIHFMHILTESLDDSFEVFYKPFMNGDQPSVVVLSKETGIMIIEINDWEINEYAVKKKGIWEHKGSKISYKSPLDKVLKYKNNVFELHINGLLEKLYEDPNYYSIIKCGVYFHNCTENEAKALVEKEKRPDLSYFHIIGKNSLNKGTIVNLFNKKASNLLTEECYQSIRNLLTPSHDPAPIQKNAKKFNDNQFKNMISEPKSKKIKGVAGSGKTLVLLQRALNSYERLYKEQTNKKRILILTYNITLVNYLKIEFEKLRGKVSKEYFYIDSYHQFISKQANKYNLHLNIDEYDKDINLFETVNQQIDRFDAIFIDEGQDFHYEWLKLLKNYFLTEDGEFVLVADEKQNIYDRSLDKDKKPKTNIVGNWAFLNKTYRLSKPIQILAQQFQETFFEGKYGVDKMESENKSGFGLMEYYHFSNKISKDSMQLMVNILDEHMIDFKDVCILSSTIEHVQSVDQFLRLYINKNTVTTFETKELNTKLKQSMSKDWLIKAKVNKLRRNKRFHFNMNDEHIKLSTIHSFKGWEMNTLVLLIHDRFGKEMLEDELIYTGLTRCRQNLLILNFGNEKYHKFFNEKIKGGELDKVKV